MEERRWTQAKRISRIAGLPLAPVAQLDRVAVSEAVGRWFESSQVRQLHTHVMP